MLVDRKTDIPAGERGGFRALMYDRASAVPSDVPDARVATGQTGWSSAVDDGLEPR
jgi:hypothetical protein